MPWDKNAAVTHADSHARRHSTGNCARYVREAIDAGGVVLGHTHYAKNYGPVLAASGFQPIHGVPQKGDVVVIQPAPGHPAGHMAIFDGANWVSDFRQLHGLYPGPAYRSARPAYIVYRHP